MRFIRQITFVLMMLLVAMLLAPVSAPAAASKEMQELQRDVAQLQDQIKTLQGASDAKFAALQALIQQTLDMANRTNTTVSALSSGVTQTMQSEMRGVRDQLAPVPGLSVKLDNASSDISDLRSAVTNLNAAMNKQQQLLSDINNQLKLMQAPPAAPPSAEGSAAPAGVAAPPPTGQTLFQNGVRDMNAGKSELALSEFAEFLHLYPNDGNAPSVQYNIGEIHYQEGQLEQAVKDFDSVIEQYSDAQITPGAYLMKGLALKNAKKPAAAITVFKALVAKFPGSDEAGKAHTQLTLMGASVPAATKKARH